MPTNLSPPTGLSNRMPLIRRPTPMVSLLNVERSLLFDPPQQQYPPHPINILSFTLTTFPHRHCCHANTPPQADPETTPPPNFKQKPMPKFKTCRDNSTKMPKRPWMFFCRSAVRLVWRFLRQGSVLRKRFMENKLTVR